MHTEILSARQKKLLPLVRSFNNDFYLAGDTAIALTIGHRKSSDFDLFSSKEIHPQAIENKIIRANFKLDRTLVSTTDEFTAMISGVKLSFVSYPFLIIADEKWDAVINLPHLLVLGAMKAYTLGRRAKWKDYVDLFFLLRDHFSVPLISNEAERIFGGSFNARLFREQLIWFKEIDYSETVEFMPNQKISDPEIEAFLLKAVKV